jgi:uncharacterized protein YkwD
MSNIKAVLPGLLIQAGNRENVYNAICMTFPVGVNGWEWCRDHDLAIEWLDTAPPADAKAALLAAHNDARTAAGLNLLADDPRLEKLATAHNNWMLRNSQEAHDEPGATLEQRFQRSMIPYTAYGENIGMGYPDPAAAMAGWMGSEPHKANILKPEFTHAGFGVGQDSKGTWYWTVDFLAMPVGT